VVVGNVIACRPLGDEAAAGSGQACSSGGPAGDQAPRAAVLEGHQWLSPHVRRRGGERAAPTRQLHASPVVPRSPGRYRRALRIPIGSSGFWGRSQSVARPVPRRRPAGDGLSRARPTGARIGSVALVEGPATARNSRGSLEGGSPTHPTTSSVVILAHAPQPGWPPVSVKISRAQVRGTAG
jgi:hypothetical protein